MPLALCIPALLACVQQTVEPLPAQDPAGLPTPESLRFVGEDHFGVIRRLTNAGENAEGYFSFAGDRISYQATFDPYECDQIFILDLLTGQRTLASTGLGRTTCAHFLPGDQAVLFSSTHTASQSCPTPPDFSQGYVWKVYPEFDIFVRNLRNGKLTALVEQAGYDAEAVVSPQGDRIAFTSTRNGDLDIYTMNLDGSDVRQLTDELGYDGGPFFSPDGTRIVYRASRAKNEAELQRYRDLLAKDMIEPTALQIYVMDAKDGGNRIQLTHNEAANFAPYFHPDGKRVIYSSNQASTSGRDFDLFLIGTDGRNNERITTCPSFDGFPMFSRDGKRLIFASNRANLAPRDTNLFLAEWRE